MSWKSAVVEVFTRKVVGDMAPIAQQVAQMVEMLPEDDQILAFAMVRKLVLAWDPDYTKATPEEDAAMKQAIKELTAGDYVLDSEINWD